MSYRQRNGTRKALTQTNVWTTWAKRILVIALFGGVTLCTAKQCYTVPVSSADVRAIHVVSFIRTETRNGLVPSVDVWLRDPAIVGMVMAVVDSADRRFLSHACDDTGWLTFEYADGHVEEASVLPGHHEAYFELRSDRGLFRVRRAEFFDALRRGGIEPSALDPW